MTRIAAPLVAVVLAGCASGQPSDGNSAASAVSTTYPPPIRAVPVTISPAPAGQTGRSAGEAIRYEGAFNKCAACHTLTAGRHGIGPSLAGTYGGLAASATNYRYSAELQASDLVWDAATLDAFLENPRALVPGTKMVFSGLRDPAERAQVIAYIERYAD